MKYNYGFDSFDRSGENYVGAFYMTEPTSVMYCNELAAEGTVSVDAALDNSITTLSSAASCIDIGVDDTISSLSSSLDKVSKALKKLAEAVGYKMNDNFDIEIDSKNEFCRVGRLRRSQLKTL